MEYWQALHMAGVGELVPLAERAEALGFTGIALGDHALLPERWDSPYPYSPDGRVALDSTSPFPDPWVVLGAIAARTSRLRMTTWVYVLPLRDPFSVGKSVATLDVLSGGRFTFGVGVGWLEEEFDAVGVDFARRGARTDEMLEVMSRVWSGERVSHEGEHFSFRDVVMRPAPLTHVPICVGGHSDVALRRAARYDGWFALPLDDGALAARLDRLAELRRDAGGTGGTGYVLVMVDSSIGRSEVSQLAEMGVDGVVFLPLDPALSLADRIDALRAVADRHL